MKSSSPYLPMVALGLAATGCIHPNTYGTPRTTPSGEFAHTLAVESYAQSSTLRGAFVPAEKSVVPPTYAFRYGLADRVDLGFKVANVSSLGLGLKWNFFRAERLDLALAPATQLALDTTFLADMPLLVGINLAREVSVVLSPGAAFSRSLFLGESADEEFQEPPGLSRQARGPKGWARMGLGLSLRFTRHFALHPEVTVMRSLEPDAVYWMNAGIGIQWGGIPSYE